MKQIIPVALFTLGLTWTSGAYAELPATAGVSAVEAPQHEQQGVIAPAHGAGALGGFTTGQLILGAVVIGTIIAATNDGGGSSRSGTTGTTP